MKLMHAKFMNEGCEPVSLDMES